MRFLYVLAALLLCLTPLSPAHAAPRARQTAFEADKQSERWSFQYKYTDATGKIDAVAFELPTASVVRDNGVPLQFPKRDAVKAELAAVEAYAASLKGPKVTARAAGSGLRIDVSGRDAGRMRDALNQAQAAAKTALGTYLSRHRYTELRGGDIAPDHARLAAEYADDVRPVAAALAVGAPDARTFVARALAFVQAIPYESGKAGADKGYRRPLSVLARNKGDCDSKSTLFLALVRSAHPELDSVVVYVPNHAFAGVALDPGGGERTFSRDGVRYVGVEPVGPARAPVGTISGKSGWHLFWHSAETRALPAPK